MQRFDYAQYTALCCQCCYYYVLVSDTSCATTASKVWDDNATEDDSGDTCTHSHDKMDGIDNALSIQLSTATEVISSIYLYFYVRFLLSAFFFFFLSIDIFMVTFRFHLFVWLYVRFIWHLTHEFNEGVSAADTLESHIVEAEIKIRFAFDNDDCMHHESALHWFATTHQCQIASQNFMTIMRQSQPFSILFFSRGCAGIVKITCKRFDLSQRNHRIN